MLNTLGGGGNRGNQLVQFGGSLNSLAATIVSGAGRLSHGERRTGHDQQRRTRPVHRHGHLRAGLRRDARDGDSRTVRPDERKVRREERAQRAVVPPLRPGHGSDLRLRRRRGGYSQLRQPLHDHRPRDRHHRGRFGRRHLLVPDAHRPLRGRSARRQGLAQGDAFDRCDGSLPAGHLRHALPRQCGGEHARLPERHFIRHGAGSGPASCCSSSAACAPR